jgi:hypothetical protein
LEEAVAEAVGILRHLQLPFLVEAVVVEHHARNACMTLPIWDRLNLIRWALVARLVRLALVLLVETVGKVERLALAAIR